MSQQQSQMHAAMEEAQRARQKKREAAEALRARQHEYETVSLRGRQNQITSARVALGAAQAAYEAAKRDVQRLDDKTEEVIQAQVRAAYM
jgi:aspartate ammonia-lyase